MPRYVLDIETAGVVPFDTLEPWAQESILKGAKSDEEIAEAKVSLGLYPPFSEIVVIGLLDVDVDKGHVFYQAPGAMGSTGEGPDPFEEMGLRFECATESEMLRQFWHLMESCTGIVTYNGRGFDGPFLHMRSAIRQIKPTRELVPNRYADWHIDLMDRFSYYGSMRRRFSLDVWCRAFGVPTPKGEMCGKDVSAYFLAGRHLDIARYNARDLHATRELFLRWERFMKP